MSMKVTIGLGAALLAVGGGAAAVFVRAHHGPGSDVSAPAAITPPPNEVRTSEGEATLAAVLDERTPVETTPAEAGVRQVVRGTVIDPAGQPIEGAQVFVGGYDNPFGRDDGEAGLLIDKERVYTRGVGEWRSVHDLAERKDVGLAFGRLFETDAEGVFEASFARSVRVVLSPHRTVGVQPGPGQTAWFDTPATEISFTAQRLPLATLAIRVLDTTTGEYLEDFAGTLHMNDPDPPEAGEDWDSAEFSSRGQGVAKFTVEMSRNVVTYLVDVEHPPWADGDRQITLTGGTHQDVQIEVQSGDGFEGVVLDGFGSPVEGAVVFWGDTLRMRQGQPFRAFSEEGVPDAVHTGADGRFSLPGGAAEVSVWHAEHSPVTVAVAEASSISLAGRGSVRGRVLDETGQPRAGARVTMDRAIEVSTGADGVYVFENVEAGTHGVVEPGERWFGLEVAPGEVTLVDVQWIGDVEVEVLSGGRPFEEHFGGVVVGSGQVYALREFGNKLGHMTLWKAIAPATYTIVSQSGRVASFDVETQEAVLELGEADLTVSGAAPGTELYLLPEGSSPQVAYWCVRIAREASDAGEVTWGPIPAGRYEVGSRAAGPLGTVEVTGAGTMLQLGE